MNLSEYLAKNPKKYLIFDFDETIAKLEMDWSHYFSEMGLLYKKFDPSCQHVAFSEFEGCNDFVRKYGQKVSPLIRAATQDYEKKFNHGLTPYPELVEFIKNVQGYELSVYSSNSRQTVLKGLAELGLIDKFEQIVSRDEVTYIKPDPDGFSLIYDPTTAKEDYLMIGNSSADKGMAEAVGIDFFLAEYFRPI
ncbi:MAG: HAD-IA family hydrolase [Candidatus Pacebacteria bacterium]|jgi:HAD superfamily hydrolase (TIGR01549 family)|nr:HAD-IA family hydrolase [Candidatus Paceibacterota bacterium]MBT3511980.1 HAD-IA family hydrolase [Candidatus Paceibacterota bacterium]MBT4005302.1 HAD-IA family hydrolase [Candidatus Paceibacterota bacterium]MBT4358521.1 HAD-IA family hydrolase [Candidatus Paceibacterota bacterium]MBT4681169.1 HAD-IA family hydrolase [Candidatus Paceibacterota bacterium]